MKLRAEFTLTLTEIEAKGLTKTLGSLTPDEMKSGGMSLGEIDAAQEIYGRLSELIVQSYGG